MNLESFVAKEACTPDASSQLAAKKAAGLAAVELVEDGMIVGLGTGSTVQFFLEGLAKRILDDGLKIKGVPTSAGTEGLARRYGIPLIDGDFKDLSNDLCVDGADRVDAKGNLIKGGGGALLREKMVASASTTLCILIDPIKLEPVLGASFPLPVECVPFGIETTMARLRDLGCEPCQRMRDGTPFISDNGLCIVDCSFKEISAPQALELAIKRLPGVVEVGLFCGIMKRLILGRADGSTRVLP